VELLNRTALVVTPKRRFIEWVNRLPDAGTPLRPDELHSLRNVYAVATGDLPPDLQEVIDTYWEEIFAQFLREWVTDESLWPANRTPHTFRDWFGVELIEFVADLDPQEPITVAEAARTQCAMCGGALDNDRTAVALGDTVRRLSAQEVDEWERAIAAGDEPSIDAAFILRCCGTACAERAEEVLHHAAEEQARSKS
jgi:hypothetical protein